MLDYLRQAPLDRLSLAARAKSSLGSAGVGLSELRFRGAINLRLRRDDSVARDAAAAFFGSALPTTNAVVRSGEVTLLGLGPDEWLLVGGDGPLQHAKIKTAFEEHFAAVTDVSENYCTLKLTGPQAAVVLQKGCSLDFDPAVFAPGSCAQSLLSKAAVILERQSENDFVLLCRRSFAEYVFRWLEDASVECGFVVLA